MKLPVNAILGGALLAAALYPAAKPDFSGVWKLDITRSAFGPVPVPARVTRKITHSEPSLTIAEEQKGGAGDQSYTRQYTTDGKEISYSENGANVKAAASWEGDALVIRSIADAGGTTLQFIQTLTLSNGGTTLKDVTHVITPQGEFDITYIFDKQ